MPWRRPSTRSDRGRVIARSHEAQQYRASGLNLVTAAIVYWNSIYVADAVAHLRAQGEIVPDELLTHTSPVGWEHIAFSGDLLWVCREDNRPEAAQPGWKTASGVTAFRLRSTLTLFSGKPALCPHLGRHSTDSKMVECQDIAASARSASVVRKPPPGRATFRWSPTVPQCSSPY